MMRYFPSFLLIFTLFLSAPLEANGPWSRDYDPFNLRLAGAHREKGYDHYISICAIFQNEARWMEEWIEYHLLQGVTHFRLYNHYSDDDFERILAPYIEEGIVELIDWSKADRHVTIAQPAAYDEALRVLEGKSVWIAFIDIDEFLVPIQNETLTQMLSQYESYGGLVVNWKNFGTSHVSHLEEDELLIERLTMAIEPKGHESLVIKSIVRPEHTKESYGVHRFTFRPGYYAVDTGFRRSDPPANSRFRYQAARALDDRLVLNHYRLRTMDWAYGFKLERNIRIYWSTYEKERAKIQRMDALLSRQEDLRIQRFVPRLRARIRCRRELGLHTFLRR